ncbi:MAG TPA: hypothetical protein VGG84_06215 [Gemmatimonadaceae bacterium]
MKTRAARVLVAAALATAVATASAQDPRIGMRLDAPTRAALVALVDSARAQGLPVEPLMEKMYEGYGKGADGPRIVAAVRSLALEMASAHRALGTVASADEIKAAASAMHAGVPAVELGKMKKESSKLRRSLTLPFTVLADIVSRGVPVQTAANAIRSLVGAGARDTDINTFQRNVSEDIELGAPPAAAAETRAKGAVPPAKPDGAKPELL